MWYVRRGVVWKTWCGREDGVWYEDGVMKTGYEDGVWYVREMWMCEGGVC